MFYDVDVIRTEYRGLARQQGGRPTMLFGDPAGMQMAHRAIVERPRRSTFVR
jgi:hypothetical protein